MIVTCELKTSLYHYIHLRKEDSDHTLCDINLETGYIIPSDFPLEKWEVKKPNVYDLKVCCEKCGKVYQESTS